MSVRVEHGDSRDVVKSLSDCSLDACVTDPPYALTNNSGVRSPYPGQYTPIGRPKEPKGGFMGKQWDTGETAFDPDFWREIYRALKPGAHVVAFAGTRTYHRLACAIEDAGFDIRDMLSWMYGSGFPKSHNQHDEWEGWGTALKPALEPIAFGRKPLIGTVAANLAAHGTGAINIDGCRIGTEERTYAPKGTSANACMIRVPEHRDGVAGDKVTVSGRWPANVLHDGSEEVLQAFAQFGDRGQTGPEIRSRATPKTKGIYGQFGEGASRDAVPHDEPGSPARFFFSGKADADDRIGSKHPTVKPVALMRWLVRLVTPKGGIVLDPFAGTGTTGVACIREGMDAILIEREAEYYADIQRRLAMLSGLDTPLLAGAAE